MNLNDAQQMYMALNGYVATDEDTSGTIEYYGFANRTGQWYILAQNNTVSTNPTFRYTRGDSGYTTAWTARANPAIPYDYFYNIFDTSI